MAERHLQVLQVVDERLSRGLQHPLDLLEAPSILAGEKKVVQPLAAGPSQTPRAAMTDRPIGRPRGRRHGQLPLGSQRPKSLRSIRRRVRPAPVGVEVLRGETVESVHRIHAVVVDGSGNALRLAGDPERVTYLRSAAKPLQAIPLVASGAADKLGLRDEELALLCGSHAGEPRHVAAVRSILGRIGLSESALQCGTHGPRNAVAKAALAGGRASAVHHNCSGKHAGMLALQVHLGGPSGSYLDPASPAQQAIREAIREVCGAEPLVGTDGCSAPNFALPLRHAAQGFARLALPQGVRNETADALGRLARCMARHPEMVAGESMLDTDLMGASEDRLVSKAGAEGVQCVGDLTTGAALALKVEDGAARAVAPATIEALRQLSWLEPRALEVLGDWWMPAVKNHAGRVVGRIKPTIVLEEARST